MSQMSQMEDFGKELPGVTVRPFNMDWGFIWGTTNPLKIGISA